MDSIKTIGIKQLHKEMGHIAKDVEKGTSFLVMKNTHPVFRIEPIEKKGRYTLSDMKKVRFRGNRNVSKQIDAIVYGTK